MLIIWMLTVQLSYCQTSYPSKIVIEGDTLVAITVDQAKKVNRAFISADHYKKLSDSLELKASILKEKSENDSSIIQKKDVNIGRLESIVGLQDQANVKLKEEYDSVTTKYMRSREWGRIKNQALGASAIAILLIILVK